MRINSSPPYLFQISPVCPTPTQDRCPGRVRRPLQPRIYKRKERDALISAFCLLLFVSASRKCCIRAVRQNKGDVCADPGLFLAGRGRRPREEDVDLRKMNLRLCDRGGVAASPGGCCLIAPLRSPRDLGFRIVDVPLSWQSA